jgi:serine O-acetyltransferase
VNRIIKADLYRHDGLTGIKGFIIGWFYPGFRYTYLFRKAQEHKKYSLRGIVYRLLKRRYRFKYGYEIDPDSQIGEGLYLSDHCGGVIIGPIKMGKNCNIAHSVTIGRTNKDGKIGIATIENNVWIGTGSVLVGSIHVGKNVLIAPNSYVNFDIPDNSLVMGNPAVIIKKENPTQNYIHNILG